MNYLLGIDVGTSATKTVLFDENGRVTASASQEYPLYQPENGWAEQRPEDWADAVLNTIKEVISQSGAGKDDVKGIGISGQMHGLVMLDEMGEVIRPSIIWCDQRTGAEVEDMLKIMPREEWIRITANPPLTGWTAAKILWVRKNEPENYNRCRHILLPKDYIRYILTGVFATEVSDASGIKGKFNYDLKETFMGFHCGNTNSGKLAFCEMKYQFIMARSLPEEVTQGTLEGDIMPGDITFYRLQSTADNILRAYVAQGEVLPVATRSFGSIGIFAIPQMGRFYRHVLIEKGFPHHGAVAFGHFGKSLYEVFKYIGVDVEEIGFNQPAGMLYKTENPFA